MDNETGKQLEPIKSKERQLTPKNWLFIKYYLETGNARTAFDRAGYKGKSYSAPYEMVSSLKDNIIKIAENNGVGHGNLLFNSRILIDRPIIRVDKYGRENESLGLTPHEHLRALEFARKLIQKSEKEHRQLSPVIIKTDNGGQTQVNIGKQGSKGTKAVEEEGKVGQGEKVEHNNGTTDQGILH